MSPQQHNRQRPFVAPPRSANGWRARALRGLLLFFTLACMMLADAAVLADSYDDRRVRAGARLFRALLAADVVLETRAAADGALHVILLGGDAHTAEELTALIVPPDDAAKAQIRGMNVQIELRNTFPEAGDAKPAGIFLATPPPTAELDRLIRWSIANGVILYSPFEGHVERGATAGISIEAKVQPYLNAATIAASRIELKPFFLKVAKVHR